MQTELIVLIPPTQQQSTSSFHVHDAVFEPFVTFLRTNRVCLAEPPAGLGGFGPQESPLKEIRVAANTSVPRLEFLLGEFLAELPG